MSRFAGYHPNMEAKTVSETRITMAQMMTPNDANVLGKVFGGSILALIDLTASAVSSKFAGRVCVTAAFDRVDFHEPIEIGELVELHGVVSFVGRTSVEVTIDVYATQLTAHRKHHVNTARVTMVAVENGKPVPVPRLICQTYQEKLAFLEGRLRRETRSKWLKEMDSLNAVLREANEATLDQYLASDGSLFEALEAAR